MCLVVGIIGAVGSVGLGAANAIQQGKVAGQSSHEASTTYGEQQYYAQQLQQLIANPASVSSLPGYQFQLDQGSQAVARQMAGSGFLNSTNEAEALDQFGQGLASSFYGQQTALLSSLSGLTAPSSPAQLNSNAISATAQSGQTTSGLLNSLGYLALLSKGSGGGIDPTIPTFSTPLVDSSGGSGLPVLGYPTVG